jgi:hypothetical protein
VASYNPTYVTTVDPSAATAAANLAARGATAAQASNDWLPLGVFTVGPENQPDNAHLLQLAMNKDGAVRGTYFDAGADNGKDVQGAIDRKTQRVAFTAGKNNQRVFETGLSELTSGAAQVAVFSKGNSPAVWSLSRQAEPSEE